MNKILLILLLLHSAFGSKGHPGVGIVMDSKGNVFYTDLAQIWKINVKGKKSIVVPNVHSHEIYIDAQDNVYGEHVWYNGEALDTWGHYVWKLSSDGKIEKVIPNTKGFLSNYSFVRDRDGSMYWVNRDADCQKIVEKKNNGVILTRSDACLNNVRWMTSTPEGIIFIIDFHDLKKMDRQGHVTTLATNLADKKFLQVFVNEEHYLSGVTAHKDNVYVADYSGRQVKKITPDGKVSVAAETSLPWSPTGTLVATNGDFWLLECSATNAVRVEKISMDGKRTIY